MQFAIVFAAALAVVSAQYNPFQYSTPLPTQYNQPTPPPYQPTTYRTPVVNRVATNDAGANIISQSYNIYPDGSYDHEFQSDNGIAAQAQGTPRDFGGNPRLVPVVSQGSYSWTSPEGKLIVITYTADENGFRPSSDAIPTPHPIPEAILRSLEYNAKNPEPEYVKGQRFVKK